MEENKKTIFDDMSMMDAIDKYEDYRSRFDDIKHVMYEKARDAIVKRITFFCTDPLPDGEVIAYLPFALRMSDKKNEDRERHYEAVSTKHSHLIDLTEWIWDEEKEQDIEYSHLVLTCEEMVDLYKKLNRMGFFDEKYENDFIQD